MAIVATPMLATPSVENGEIESRSFIKQMGSRTNTVNTIRHVSRLQYTPMVSSKLWSVWLKTVVAERFPWAGSSAVTIDTATPPRSPIVLSQHSR
mmetsp:Transcript_1654/g.3861  ORF Transcript_1654/g.3861 Transcript_1654/m.3861 type:complete len:95 (-) Transcript_1654:164-448(-)